MKILLMAILWTFNAFAADSAKTIDNVHKKEMTDWMVLSDLPNDEERSKFLAERVHAGMMRQFNKQKALLPDMYFADVLLGKYGNNFSYLGRIETEFLAYLVSIDGDGKEKTVLFPGCGFGRSVLDALKKTKSYRIIANDAEKTNMQILQMALSAWFSIEQGRVTVNNQDIFALLPTLPDNSVDVIFCTNLIHFFNPAQLEKFLQECQRVLKPQGRIFLLWDGYDSFREHKLDSTLQNRANLIKTLDSFGSKYTTFSCPEVFPAELDKNSTCLHNFVPAGEVIDLAKDLDMKPIYHVKYRNKYSQLKFSRSQPTIQPLRDEFCYGDIPINKDDVLGSFGLDALILQNTKTEHSYKSTYSQDFANGMWHKKIEEHRCHQCKKIVKAIKKCSACKQARYCGEECQKKAWPLHKLSHENQS